MLSFVSLATVITAELFEHETFLAHTEVTDESLKELNRAKVAASQEGKIRSPDGRDG